MLSIRVADSLVTRVGLLIRGYRFRLIHCVVVDRDFELFIVLFFNYLCGLFYYAHDSDA